LRGRVAMIPRWQLLIYPPYQRDLRRRTVGQLDASRRPLTTPAKS